MIRRKLLSFQKVAISQYDVREQDGSPTKTRSSMHTGLLWNLHCTMIEDILIRAGDCNHLKGYIRTWKELKILVVCAMYMEALNPVSLLSHILQSDGADIMSAENSSEISKVIEVLVAAGSCEWLTAKLLRSRIEVGSQE